MDVDAGHKAEPAEAVGHDRGPVIGAVLLVAAAVAAYVLRVGGVCCDGVTMRALYDYDTWLVVAGLAVAGVILVASSSPPIRVPTAAAGGVLAAQLIGTGVVAFRRWVPVGGFGPGEWDNIVQLRLLSALLALCGVAAVVACLVSLRAAAALPVRVPWTSRAVALCAGLLVVVALPVVVAAGQSEILDVTSLGAHALVYSVPFGASLALTGWLSRPAALAAACCVLLSALVLIDANRALVSTPGHSSGLALVLVTSAVVVLARAAFSEGTTDPQ